MCVYYEHIIKQETSFNNYVLVRMYVCMQFLQFKQVNTLKYCNV